VACADESVAAAGGFVVGGFAAGGVLGAGAGWACARRMISMLAATAEDAACASVGAGIAKTFAGTASKSAPTSDSQSP
jgi:hypothetical protein